MIESSQHIKERNSYSNDLKAATLVALAVNSGNVKLTARQMGLPRRTVNAWALGRGISPAVRARAESFQKPLADLFYEVVYAVLDELLKPGRIERASFADLTRLLDIATDKWLLLEGDPATRNWRSGRMPKAR